MSKPVCGFEGCDRNARARGFCHNHYMIWWRANNPEKAKATEARRYAKHSERLRALSQERRSYDPVAARAYHLKRKYGLSEADYAAMVEDQDGCCALCEEWHGDRLAVDHDHDTGAVRMLLCFKCNVGIGFFRDDVVLAERAADYLASFGRLYKGTIGT